MSTSASIAPNLPRATSRGPVPQKRPLSDSEDTDEVETKKVKKSITEQQTTERNKQRDTREKKRRRKKKRKTSVVVVDMASRAEQSPTGTPQRATSKAPSSSAVAGRASPVTLSTVTLTSHVESTPQPAAGPSGTRVENEAPMISAIEKGKGRATPNSDKQLENSAAAVNKDTADADFQLASKIDLISRHEALLGTLTQSLTCQICLELMYKPFALAPCGHSACYSCLVNWFRAPQGADHNPAQAPAYMRKKTCPHCRAIVRERPTEVWSIKDMVDALVKSKFVEPHPDPPASTDGAADADPWAGIFRKANAMPDMALPDLLFGYHPGPEHPPEVAPDSAMARQLMGMLDEEDGGIFRCVDCLHEIWDGVCSGCGRVYPGHPSEDEDADLAAEHMLWGEDDESDYDDEDDNDDDMNFVRAELGFGPPPPWFRLGQFIDDVLANRDGGEAMPVLPRRRVLRNDPIDIEQEDYGEEDDGDTDEDEEEYVEEGSPGPRIVQVDDDDEEGEEDDDSYEGSFIDDADEGLNHGYYPPAGGVHFLDWREDPALRAEFAPLPSVRRRSGTGRGTIISDDEADTEVNDEDDLAQQVANEELLMYGDDGSVSGPRYHEHPEFDDDDPSDGEEDDLYADEHDVFYAGEPDDLYGDDEGRSEDDGDMYSEPDYDAYGW